MNNTNMIKELRALTQAGMKDCKESLEETGWDLQKAVDLVKKKGLNVVSGREGKIAAEGLVEILSGWGSNEVKVMAEINCQTDFVARSDEFKFFADHTMKVIVEKYHTFKIADIDDVRQSIIAITKENIIVRRWWIQEALQPTVKVFSYLHSNKKIGVILTLEGPSIDSVLQTDFSNLGNDLAMQIAAMNPLAISVDHLLPDDLKRQRAIFEAQLVDLNKPQMAWPKILDGKLNKWYTDVCLMNQESVIVPKTTVAQVIKNVGAKLGGEVRVVNFIRCQVGEGLEKKTSDFADEVSKMSGVI